MSTINSNEAAKKTGMKVVLRSMGITFVQTHPSEIGASIWAHMGNGVQMPLASSFDEDGDKYSYFTVGTGSEYQETRIEQPGGKDWVLAEDYFA